jgi:hypothetical protein
MSTLGNSAFIHCALVQRIATGLSCIHYCSFFIDIVKKFKKIAILLEIEQN